MQHGFHLPDMQAICRTACAESPVGGFIGNAPHPISICCNLGHLASQEKATASLS